MIIRPCPNTINCPGTDEPISNYSSEAPDGLDYINTQYYGNSPPPYFRSWNAQGCGQTFISQISQADADQQASAASALCADTGPCIGVGCPTGGGGGFFCNHAQTACVPCPDGNQFCYTVPAGLFCGYNNQARADSYAHGVAFRLAREKRFCLSNLSAPGCVGQPYNQSITATGPVITPCTWTVVSGILPPGLEFGGFSPNIDTTLGPTETIQGTPTTAGTYTFTVQCEGSDFSFMQKQYTICISSIAPTTLPSGNQGVPYSQTFTEPTACLGTPLTWTVSSGLFPTGLSLSSAGVLSGTPTNVGASGFTVLATGPNGSCQAAYVLTINAASGSITVDNATVTALNNAGFGMVFTNGVLTRNDAFNGACACGPPAVPTYFQFGLIGLGTWMAVVLNACDPTTFYFRIRWFGACNDSVWKLVPASTINPHGTYQFVSGVTFGLGSVTIT